MPRSRTIEDEPGVEGGPGFEEAPPEVYTGLPDSTLLKIMMESRQEAEDGRRPRMIKNKRNRDAYQGVQDWSHKQAGQSREFLPKTSAAVEQMSAFVKRGLTQFGDWFSLDLPARGTEIMTPDEVRTLLMSQLDQLPEGRNDTSTFSLRISDGVKAALLESLLILKVNWVSRTRRQFFMEYGDMSIGPDGEVIEGEPRMNWREKSVGQLQFDLIRTEDYYPDPTGAGLYEIHRVERDYSWLVEQAEAGIYDVGAVMKIDEDMEREAEGVRAARDLGQGETGSRPQYRKRVVIEEFWGDLIDPDDGMVLMKNIVMAVANDKYVIRKPESNPFWHQESPFVAAPIIRVPFSVWHKALYDDAVNLNFAANELFNLMLDGGLASVWGTRQIRTDWLEDPKQVSKGIPQGATLAVNSTAPADAKVLQMVVEGKVPPEAMAMFETVNREFTAASLTNEVKLGALPPKQVKATEVVEASQSQAVTLDGVVTDLETFMAKIIRKGWLVFLQHIDEVDPADIVDEIGEPAAFRLLRVDPATRIQILGLGSAFKVFGLSATMARVREFQKTMAMLQAINVNPLLARAFMLKFSADKTLRTMMKQLNINPNGLEKSEQEMQELPQEMGDMPAVKEMLSPARGGGGGASGGEGGEQLPAEINQAANPLTGMTGS